MLARALANIVDLSHCGEATSRDGIAFSKKRPAFTHTMCKAIEPVAIRVQEQPGRPASIHRVHEHVGLGGVAIEWSSAATRARRRRA